MGYQPYTGDLQNADYLAGKSNSSLSRASDLLKRAKDIIIAASAIIFLLPVLVPIAIIIRLSDGGPALFRHKRIGRNGKEFTCFKFRTMVTDAEAQLRHLLATDPGMREEWLAAQKLVNDPRITPVGEFLRKTSLDELPQLLNILNGDMSVVGPRPIVKSEIAKYGDYFDLFCEVRPGLTGLWQVSGRSDTTYDERVKLDAQYVRERSFWMDVKILFRTIPVVFQRIGAR